MFSFDLTDKFSKKCQQIFKLVTECAESCSFSSYLIGGAVRDALIANEPITPSDLDFAISWQREDRDSKLLESFFEKLVNVLKPDKVTPISIYGTFKLSFPEYSLDFAMTRKESYPHPAAKPEVTYADIEEDLRRRDYTVNAIALDLREIPNFILIQCGGLQDLKTLTLNLLHQQSLSDDPSRLIRGVRYASRLNFSLSDDSRAQAIATFTSAPLKELAKNFIGVGKAPGIQSRFRQELDLAISESLTSKKKVYHLLQELFELHLFAIFGSTNDSLITLDKLALRNASPCNHDETYRVILRSVPEEVAKLIVQNLSLNRKLLLNL